MFRIIRGSIGICFVNSAVNSIAPAEMSTQTKNPGCGSRIFFDLLE